MRGRTGNAGLREEVPRGLRGSGGKPNGGKCWAQNRKGTPLNHLPKTIKVMQAQIATTPGRKGGRARGG